MTPPTNPEPATKAGRRLLADLGTVGGTTAGLLTEDILAIEAAARAEALAPERLTAAIMAAVGAPHPDDFGIAYRQSGGFSPAGLAAAVLALLDPPK